MKNILKIILCVLVCYVTIGLGWITKDVIIHENVKDGIAVLGYHGVVSDKEKKENYASNPYFMSVSQFEKQMKYLAENNYQCLSMKEVENYYHGKKEISKKAICLTFDDGYEDNYQNAYPILKKYGFTGTIFVITDFVSNQPNYLTWEQIKEMKANGMDFQSHTASHKSMTELTEAQLKDELTKSKQTLDTQLNQDTKFMAYPTGTYNLYIAKLVNDAGYRGAFTIKYGNVDRASNIYALERVPIFHTENTFLSFYERMHYVPVFERLGWYKS